MQIQIQIQIQITYPDCLIDTHSNECLLLYLQMRSPALPHGE